MEKIDTKHWNTLPEIKKTFSTSPFLPHPSFLNMSVIFSAAGAVHVQYPKQRCETPHGFCCSPSDAKGAQVHWPLACTVQMHDNGTFLGEFGPALYTAVFSLAWDLFQALVTWATPLCWTEWRLQNMGPDFQGSCYFGVFSVYVFGARMWDVLAHPWSKGGGKYAVSSICRVRLWCPDSAIP